MAQEEQESELETEAESRTDRSPGFQTLDSKDDLEKPPLSLGPIFTDEHRHRRVPTLGIRCPSPLEAWDNGMGNGTIS